MGAIYLIRHAQASFGAADYDQLSELGLTQSRVLGESLLSRGPRTDRVVCGTMRRHEQTAEGCLQAMGLSAKWESDPGWNEYDPKDVMSAYDPRYKDPAAMAAELAASDNPRRRFQEIFVRAMDRWVSGEHDGEYSESWPAFCARVASALARVSASLAKSQGALVFTSGGPIAAACAALLNLSAKDALRLNTRLANAAITKLLCSADAIHLSTMNEHGHFEGGGGGGGGGGRAGPSGDAALITYR
jgi:broad specificity phosphatase PhoE